MQHACSTRFKTLLTVFTCKRKSLRANAFKAYITVLTCLKDHFKQNPATVISNYYSPTQQSTLSWGFPLENPKKSSLTCVKLVWVITPSMARMSLDTRSRVVYLHKSGFKLKDIQLRLKEEDIKVSKKSLCLLLKKYRLHSVVSDLPKRATERNYQYSI